MLTPHLAYTFFMLMALVVFLCVRRLHSPTRNASLQQSTSQRIALGLAAFIGGSLGSKLPFVFDMSESGLGYAAWLSDGKTLTSGLAGAYVCVELAKQMLGMLGKTGDGYALPLAAAMVVGRMGCFYNGCCYGTPTDLPWAVLFPVDSLPRHPTQIYESLFHLVMFMVISISFSVPQLHTHRLQLYLIAYCIYRILSELIRPESVFFMGLTFYQLFCIAFACGLGLQWYWDTGTRVQASPA